MSDTRAKADTHMVSREPIEVQSAIAHLAEDGREHLLIDHLQSVARLAQRFASKWNAGSYGEVAGLLHDLGKFAPDFQQYIRSAANPDDRRDAHIEAEGQLGSAKRGRVDHSSAGALKARESYGPLGELLAFVIAGHHAGLANQPDLLSRLERKIARLPDALAGSPPQELLNERTLSAPFPSRASSAAEADSIKRRFEMWIRMLFSALCDADFLDTEYFFDQDKTRLRVEARQASLNDLLGRLTAHIDGLEATAPQTEVNAVRKAIRKAAIQSSSSAPGVFTLTVPTGGGKTLAAMEFALRHSIEHGLDRVVVAIPYTSIIEQNAAVYREAFGTKEVVLEHHASFDPERETARSRLASQNWDAPVVVTTTVQLFESMFARRTSRCRKLHNLARSVIVLDEAQTMPPRLLKPTLEMLDALVKDYGASIVISTATQPALGRASLGGFGFDVMTEIVPPEIRAFERLRRVDVQWPTTFQPASYSSLADEIALHPDVLVVTHLRRDARKLTELLDEQLRNTETTHLSALMCPEHRAFVLREIKEKKAKGQHVRVVSTQLVEAGVDLDFPIVYRALAGLDSLAQAAGRCNREGRLGKGILRVFVPDTSPPVGVPRAGRAIAEGMLRANPSLDLFAVEPHRTYFERLYSVADTDAKDVQSSRSKLLFEDTSRLYKLIEDEWSQSVVVNYGRSQLLLDELRRRGPSRSLLQRLGLFSVNAPKRSVAEWLRAGSAVIDDESGVISFAPHVLHYDDRFGLVADQRGGSVNLDMLIIDG